MLGVVRDEGLREDRSKKLLIFTEHKDTLDYLVEKLRGEGFDVAIIHGGLKLPDRIAQERQFRERSQIMVATEAAGEGINLQFCHLMVNYDIPWNPNRLEQRMGRIHPDRPDPGRVRLQPGGRKHPRRPGPCHSPEQDEEHGP